MRYVEKLATPDVTIADMIGDLDPIKAARSSLQLSDELTMHYGLVPRANRGIFAINELPDLAGKIQVGLFNILQEGDVQIKGYPVRLPLDLLMVFSANPEDYTARGKIITPLKDRIGSEIRTHYPATRQQAMQITAQEAWTSRDGSADRAAAHLPDFVREVVEEVAFQARQDQKIDKRSGVSQRLPISLLENVVSNAERRALATGESAVVPRVTDVYAAIPGDHRQVRARVRGRAEGGRQRRARADPHRPSAIVFNGWFPNADHRQVTEWFDLGGNLQVDDTLSAADLLARDRAGAGAPRARAPGGARQAAGRTAARGGDRFRPRRAVRAAQDQPLARKAASRRPSRSSAPPRRPSIADGARHPADRQQEEVLQLRLPHANTAASTRDTRRRKCKYRYSKFTGDDLDELDLEELLSKLSDLLLSSGFDSPYGMPYDDDDDAGHSWQSLHDAIMEALLNGGHAVGRDARAPARQGLARRRRRRAAARRADREDHREAAVAGLSDRPARPRA